MNPKAKIGKNLKKAREDKKLTQSEVAEKAGISVNYYARIERDEVNPSIEIVENIVKVLGVRSCDILPF
jgi:transcriptional regulator with XRE-family HTH domain